jgi:hypothetical protein
MNRKWTCLPLATIMVLSIPRYDAIHPDHVEREQYPNPAESVAVLGQYAVNTTTVIHSQSFALPSDWRWEL